MVSSDRVVDTTLASPAVTRRDRRAGRGPRLTAALLACAAALQLAAPPPALAQTGEVCRCESGDSNWWLALFPGVAGLLSLLPGRGVPPAAPVVLPPAVVRPEYAAPPPIALPPAEVGAPPAVRPIAPGADTRIPIRKRRPLAQPSSAYNGPVPRFKVLRQLLGVPESAVAARTRETAPAVQPAARPAPARAPAASQATTPTQTAARGAAPRA